MVPGRIAPRGARANPSVRCREKADEAEAIADLAAYHARRQEVLVTHELPVMRLLRRVVAAHCRRAELAARERAARLRVRSWRSGS